jgi:hypothetical protein
MSSQIDVTDAAALARADKLDLQSIPQNKRDTAIKTLDDAIKALSGRTLGTGLQEGADAHAVPVAIQPPSGNEKQKFEKALGVLQRARWPTTNKEIEKYVLDPEPDMATLTTGQWFIVRAAPADTKEPKAPLYLLKHKTSEGRTDTVGLTYEDLLGKGLSLVWDHFKAANFAGSTPTTIFGVKLDTNTKKVAAVGIALLVFATPIVAVGALLRGGAAPRPAEPLDVNATDLRVGQPTPRERPVPRFVEPLDVNDTDLAANLAVSRRVVQLIGQATPWEGAPRPLPTAHWEYFDFQRDIGFEELAPLEQVQEAAGFTILTQQLGPETPTSVLQKTYNEGTARIRALQKSAGQVQDGAQKLRELEDSTIKVGSALLKRFKTDLEKTLQRPAKSIENIEEVFIATSDQLKRTARLLKKMRPFLNSQEITDTEKFIEENQAKLEAWKAQQTLPLKKKWDAELKALQVECSKATDVDAVETLVARLNTLSDEIEQGARVFEASTLTPLKSEITKLRGVLSKEIATKQAAQYRASSIDTLSEMATSLIDNPQEAPKPNPFLERQTEALRSLPKDSPQREYYQQSLALQRRFDSHTRTIAKLLSTKPLTAISVEFLKAELEELDKINTQMLKFYKTREAKEDSKANLEPFRTAFVGARLAVAKEVTNSLGTMSAADRAGVRPWVNKVLDDISPAVNEHLPDHQETIAKLRTMAEGTWLEGWVEWLAKETSEAHEALWTPKSLNPFNR